nr:hypothetical protein [Gemmatales bacterium]
MPSIHLFVACFLWITINEPDNSPNIDPPLAEQFLRTGKIEDGCKALTEKLSTNDKDDEIRYGLGILQITRAVEKLGQSLYRHGLQNQGNSAPYVRLPVPVNPSPEPISIKAFRGILDEFQKDLLKAEKTLSGITSETVKLRLRVAIVKMDFDNDGIPTDYLVDVIDKLMGGRPDFLKNNPEFRAHFDRGDVAWFRAYCHLLAAVVDLYQSLQTDADFYLFASSYFPKLEPPLTSQALIELRKSSTWNTGKFVIEDAKRLSSFRQHMIHVCQLNHETWKYILQESDN